jgi:hypothetical protein
MVVESQVSNIVSAFSQFTAPAYNAFSVVKHRSLDILVRHYIFRQFPW